jgi:phosphoadenosine phosphosulfate reductase
MRTNNSDIETVHSLQRSATGQSIQVILQDLISRYPGQVTFSTSFGWEDQVITDIILRHNFPVSIFTLDTGRMFPETYATWQKTNEAYGVKIGGYYPDSSAAAAFVSGHGPNAFYESPDLRKACCYIRKVVPLKAALHNKAVWITGLRSAQSATRTGLSLFQWDDSNHVIKYNPLLEWSLDEVTAYIQQHNVPYNPLHDRGFVSIGCAPCTRAIQPGEDFRAGRWWWEEENKKECGLHLSATITQTE